MRQITPWNGQNVRQHTVQEVLNMSAQTRKNYWSYPLLSIHEEASEKMASPKNVAPGGLPPGASAPGEPTVVHTRRGK